MTLATNAMHWQSSGVTQGQIIRERRQHLGLTQAELAARVGRIDSSAISNIERGRVRIGHERARRFADALGIDPKTLDGETETRPSLQSLLDRLEELGAEVVKDRRESDRLRREVVKALQHLAALVDVLVERSETQVAPRSRARSR